MKVLISEKRFSDKVIFRDFSCDIPDGSVTLVKGPSGSGKTTLMRMITGLDNDYEGSIEGPEKPIILFQEDRLVESISVLSNLSAVTGDRKKAAKALSEVGLSGEENNTVRNLSGGMKRRLSIARMLLVPGDAVFLDEPFRGLDVPTGLMIWNVIKNFSSGRTVFVIDHTGESIIGEADAVINLGHFDN